MRKSEILAPKYTYLWDFMGFYYFRNEFGTVLCVIFLDWNSGLRKKIKFAPDSA